MRLVAFDDHVPGALENDATGVPGHAADAAVVVDLSGVAPSVEALIEGGLLSDARAAMANAPRRSLADVTLCAPIRPASLRDFLAFEDHAKAGAARRNEELNPAWYQMPVYYKGNHRQIIGPDEPLSWPSWTEYLDFECEIACVVGTRVHDVSPDEAHAAIFGYTIMNDWSARDVQRAEMAMRLGPAKSKDFATSLGPCIVTADEFDPSAGLAMSVRVNGETWFETTDARMHWSFAQMISYVSRGEEVYPCDVYGSGTSYGGCGLDQDRRLARSSLVELDVEGLGVLRTQIT